MIFCGFKIVCAASLVITLCGSGPLIWFFKWQMPVFTEQVSQWQMYIKRQYHVVVVVDVVCIDRMHQLNNK